VSTSSWLVGSATIAAQTITINGGAVVLPAGTYYLRDATGSRSLLAAMVTAMTSGGVAAAAAEVLLNRKVKLSGGANFTITWPADAVLRNLLGFSGNLAAASAYTASSISPLLWSPGKPESPMMSPLGCDGRRVYLAQVGVAEDGSTFSTVQGYRTMQRYEWRYVHMSRVQTSAIAGGEFARWWAEVGIKARWKLYRAIPEDDASITAVTWPTAIGPYWVTPDSRSPDWDFERSGGFELADCRANLAVACHIVPEVA